MHRVFQTVHRADYDAYFTVIPAIGEASMKQYPDLKCAVPAYCFIIYLDGEYKETDINVEYCEAVDRMMPDFDGIVFKKMESVLAVSVMHKARTPACVKRTRSLFNGLRRTVTTSAAHPGKVISTASGTKKTRQTG